MAEEFVKADGKLRRTFTRQVTSEVVLAREDIEEALTLANAECAALEAANLPDDQILQLALDHQGPDKDRVLIENVALKQRYLLAKLRAADARDLRTRAQALGIESKAAQEPSEDAGGKRKPAKP